MLQPRNYSCRNDHCLIDTLKETVPIWKKELYEDGSEWKSNKECFFTKKTSENPEKDQQIEILAGQADPSLVQITATNQELDKRINSNQLNPME